MIGYCCQRWLVVVLFMAVYGKWKRVLHVAELGALVEPGDVLGSQFEGLVVDHRVRNSLLGLGNGFHISALQLRNIITKLIDN